MTAFRGKTVLMSGGSRGIGLAIALRLAREGANVALLAKTDQPHPKLPGTVHTAAQEVRDAGGQALAIVGDVRDEASVAAAVKQTVERFGGIDVLVNNASAIDLTSTPDLPTKRFDLMYDINVRGTYLLSRHAYPHLAESANGHVVTLSPPLNPDPKWLALHAAYTASKYSMTMLTLGLAETGRADGVAANCLWPRTMIDTAAVRNGLAIDPGRDAPSTRTPEIMADAAHVIVSSPAAELTGRTLIDEDVLRGTGVTDFRGYLAPGATEAALEIDLFL
ncbi:NAD(P)-dependent oxidoreductase [Pseudonocardia halophobica]|uniref:Short chain dehydrogenase n=1 Tax=Pseudonocardia halophobica TaxID=29401 RepID=A0A9W6NVH5_9PSEU|nr:NAD(P)-dependent oxidoreductase [Pseudonocardia halophobica]GLL10618.1 short chain dehydrogenase [Pseudonocardia halophobica]